MSIVHRKKESNKELALPDPATKFPNPGNAELFAFLKKRWLETSNARAEEILGDYPTRTHPELTERFRSLAPSSGLMQSSAYGCAIMANSLGLVFAWASGMNDIFLRLPRNLQRQAMEEAGRFDSTYGEDWVNFLAFGSRYGIQVVPDDALHHWMRIAYEESLKLATPTARP